MNDSDLHSQLINITALATNYCASLENVLEFERFDFINNILNLLPRIYWNFSDVVVENVSLSPDDEFDFLPSYIDEDMYESVRRGVAALLEDEDVYLETFEEDMKYSDTPIAASISEGLADIYQHLYDFVAIVRESDGEQLQDAYRECHDSFVGSWSQTLCNVMRALNHLRYNL
ncbi:MAG: DUF5063 domain-containing protein [Muribaculaceae bacterium]|nr:DUF5063 domain-containing protein [Bacteroidales bacterium]MDD6701075.1 DUF5063 domain-containing protein [Bacteroidales bacterium]MDD6942583.1 DUF5063 domain-containing protein [Bacteroidales bacterium]MDY2733718.1 DUF5063 domain-containing protein [Muribaculaceae bacterium]MDY4649001.1 DUF5063 domain-containing protein [Muribaculaceae bacterium]